jgi:outer membrane cobalamin receptor
MVVAEEPHQMLEVVIVANETILENEDDHVIPKTVIKLNHDSAQFYTLNDILKHVNSVQIRQSGGYGAFSSVSIRGSSPNQVNVFLDGVAFDAINNSSTNLSQINLSMIKRIEIYRGNTPVSLGENPIGGSINLITRKSNVENSIVNGYAGIGSFGTWFTRADLSLSNEKTQHFFNIDHIESMGDYDFVDKKRTPFDSSDDVSKTRQNNEYKKTAFFMKSGVSLKDQRNIEFSQYITLSERGLAGPGFAQTKEASYSETTYLSRVSARLFDNPIDRRSLNLNFHYKKNTSKLYDPLSEIGLGKQNSKDKERRLGFQTDYVHILKGFKTNWVLGYDNEIFKPNDRYITFNKPKSTRDIINIGVDSEFILLEKIVLKPSIRHKKLFDNFASTLPGFFHLTEKKEAGKSSFSMSGLYYASNDLKITANVSQNVRFPDLVEIFGDKGGTMGNSKLQLEKSFNADLGFEWSSNLNLFFLKETKILLNVFSSERKNLIQYVFDARGVGRAQNIAKGSVRGLELTQNIIVNDRLFLSHSLSKIESEIVSSPFKTDIGKQVPGVYNLTYSAKCEYNFYKYTTYFSYYQQNDMFYDKTNLLPAEDKNIVDWGIRYRFKPFYNISNFKREGEIAFEIKNLTKNHIEDFAGWPQPERSFILSIKF